MNEIVLEARRFVDEELIPLEKRWLETPFNRLAGEIEVKRRRVRELGLWGPCHPRSLGGMGLSFADYVPLSEELGRTPFGHYVFHCHAPDAGNIELLRETASEEQRRRYLLPLAEGRIRSCFAMTERDTAGSNPVLLATTARREAEEYVLDGEKWFTTGADGADFAVVMAVTDPGAAPHARASLFLVPMKTPGLRIVRNIPVMGHAGEGLLSHSQLELRGCRVPAADRLGEEGRGFALAQRRLGPGRIQHVSRWLGVARRALELLCERANGRRIDEDGTLATRQLVQAWVAESAAELAAARALVLEVARRLDAEGAKRSQVEIGILKFHVAGVLQRGLDRAIQAHGAAGLTDDLVLAFYWRQERAARIYDGPDEVHKLSVGARILEGFRAREPVGGIPGPATSEAPSTRRQ